MISSRVVLAIDIGGTKFAAALVDADGGVHHRAQVPALPSGSGEGEALWATMVALLDAVVGDAEVGAVGIGCGGPMDWRAGAVSPLNLLAWRDFPLQGRVADRYPGVPIRLANDAIAMAIGEHWKGVGAGVRNLLGMVVSTGVGGGLVLDSRVQFGATGNAGHLGHVVVDPAGPPCRCGGQGCLEAIARGPGLVQWALDQGWSAGDAVPDGRSLAAAAHSGDAIAVSAFTRAGTAVGIALASAVHLLELDVIAIGGGLANSGDLLMAPVLAAFAHHARLPFARNCRIVRASLGNDAGLVGAAALVLCGDRYWPSGAD